MTHSTNVLVRASLPRSRHERAIVHAITQGATIDTLLRSPKWTLDDVSKTMQRYSLTATEDGLLVKTVDVHHDLMHLAEHSPSPRVRHQAAVTAQHQRRLRQLLDDETRLADREAEQARQRAALDAWRTWLKTALTDATAEMRRLRPRPQRRTGA